MIRTRFAPSPTGYLHVGGLRTALYSYLYAKSKGGSFLVRIEDTDRERYVEGGVENILSSLYWAGVIPDEGVVLENDTIVEKGVYGPYTQSKRIEIYKKYAEKLLENGNAYYCFCSPERLENLREDQQKKKLPTGYDQYCLKNISLENASERIKNGERHVIRLKMPKSGETTFNDLIRGEVKFKNELVDDQVLIKSDGFPTYHLAVVVDDHEMQISHVIRGEEWISSTPKHIQLYKCFGWEAPNYAHLPLLLNSDKSKLSKRQGDVAVSDYQGKGYLPEALVNFVSFLGWNPGDNRELFSLHDLISEFNLEKVNKTGAVFNLEKLDWFNKTYISNLDDENYVRNAFPFFEKDEFYKNYFSLISDIESWKKKDFLKIINLEKLRIKILSELPPAVRFIFELPNYEKDQLIWKKGSAEELKEIFPKLIAFLKDLSDEKWEANVLEKEIGEWIKTNGYGMGNVLWPFRVSLSGQQNSPGPFEIASTLGKSETLRRVEVALNKL